MCRYQSVNRPCISSISEMLSDHMLKSLEEGSNKGGLAVQQGYGNPPKRPMSVSRPGKREKSRAGG